MAAFASLPDRLCPRRAPCSAGGPCCSAKGTVRQHAAETRLGGPCFPPTAAHRSISRTMAKAARPVDSRVFVPCEGSPPGPQGTGRGGSVGARLQDAGLPPSFAACAAVCITHCHHPTAMVRCSVRLLHEQSACHSRQSPSRRGLRRSDRFEPRRRRVVADTAATRAGRGRAWRCAPPLPCGGL